MIITLETERLLLRGWKEEDREPFFRLNSNPEVMEFFLKRPNKEQNNTFVDNLIRKFETQGGWGLWAVERKQDGAFIGMIGLNIPSDELPCYPCVEIGWQLDKPFWGKGYTCEAARRIFDFAFTEVGLDEVVALTSVLNYRSESVMKKLGMIRDEKTFLHPLVPEGHRLREHVLYRIRRSS